MLDIKQMQIPKVEETLNDLYIQHLTLLSKAIYNWHSISANSATGAIVVPGGTAQEMEKRKVKIEERLVRLCEICDRSG